MANFFIELIFSVNGLALMTAVGLLAWFFLFRNKGKVPVLIEMYELQGNRLIRLNPSGASKGHIKKDRNVDMLFIPKKWDKDQQGIEVPKGSDYIPNFSGVRLVKVCKLNEGEFNLIKHDLVVEDEELETEYTLIDRDISFWAENQKERVGLDYKNESTWDKIRPFATLAVVGFICFLMVYATIDQVNEMAMEAAGEREETINLIQRFIDRNNENVPSGSETQQPTDSPPPPVND